MKERYLILLPVLVVMTSLLSSCSPESNQNNGRTEILKWKDGKMSAASLTYDDGSINQFRVALPMMEEKGFPGTFFINTGQIPGSEFKARFIGSPFEEIIKETAVVPTNLDNLFESGATDPTFWVIDNSAKCLIVPGIDGQPDISQQILHFFPLVKG